MNPYFNPKKRHHRPRGFQNNYQSFRGKRWHELLRWRVQAWRRGHPPPPSSAIPQQPADLAFIHANAQAASMQPAVTWVGHITVLAQIGGLNILTDPVFSERASPLQWAGPRRHTPPGLTLQELPHIDVVLISHNHYDHLDDPAVRALARQQGGSPLFLVPLGIKPWMERRGIHRVVELDWWDEHRVHPPHAPQAAFPVTFVPARHWSARSATDALQTLWGGFVVQAPDCHLLFAGDTAYSQDFTDIRHHFAASQQAEQGGGFDLALLPIGAYEPRWFMQDQHVNPAEAVQIHLDLGAKRSLGVHWGTFQLTDEALDQPPQDLAAARHERGLTESDFFTLAIGQSWRIPPRHRG